MPKTKRRKRRQSSGPSLLDDLAGRYAELFELVLEKLGDAEIRCLSRVSTTLRERCRGRWLRQFVDSTLDLNTAKTAVQSCVDRVALGGMEAQRSGPLPPEVAASGVWEHFPGEVEYIHGWSAREPYYLSVGWRQRRRSFLRQCRGPDLEAAARACGELRCRAPPKLVLTRPDKVPSPLSILATDEEFLPIHDWWKVEKWGPAADLGCVSGVFVHPESIVYDIVLQATDSETRKERALLFLVEPLPFCPSFAASVLALRERLEVPEFLVCRLYWLLNSHLRWVYEEV